MSGHTSKVRVPDDLGREPLDVAKTALSGGDVDRALSVYQDILDRLSDKLAAVHRAPRSGKETDHILPGDRFSGLRDYVATLIREIPDGLARYREREGPRAAADLERALAARDEEHLKRIAVRWELTPSGPKALAALADILFQTGRVTEARLCADRLRALAKDAGQPPELGAQALLRTAVARAALEQTDELKSLAGVVANGDASLSVTWRGEARPLHAVIEEIIAGAGEHASAPPGEKTLAAFGKPAWQSHLVRHDVEDLGDDFVRFGSQPMMAGTLTTYYPIIPAVSESAVYYCDGLKVEAIGLMTGSPMWPPVRAPVEAFQGRRHWNLMHEVVLDRGVVYACLEDEPDIKSDHQHRISGFRPIETIAVRKLYAIDANTGDVRWTHASPDHAADAEERAFFNRISVNTPPLVLGDRVYVGATYYFGGFRQWLCAFDRDTGRLVWRTYVGQGQAELNMFGNPLKEVVPGYVGESNGLLVYSTNIGVVAAVDAVTGTPKWVTAYDQELAPSSDGQRSVDRAPGWTVQRPLFYAGRAIIAPSDSFHAYTFNMETGEARVIPGATRMQPAQFRHVVGIHDDALIVSGRRVHAFDLKPLANGDDPRPKWQAPPDGAMVEATIEGRPAVAGDRLFYTGRSLMTPGGQQPRHFVACIDVKSGRILEEKRIQGALFRGNIVITPDAVVVAGDQLTAMFDVDEVSKRLAAAVERTPNDPDLRLRLGQIALQTRDFGRAIDEFERARKLAASSGPLGEPVHESASLALYNLLLALAVEPIESPSLPASPKDRFERALGYATTPRQQVNVLYRELLWAKKTAKPAIVRDLAARILNEFPEERVRVDFETTAEMPELARGVEMKAGLLAALIGASTMLAADQAAEAVALYQQALARFSDDAIPAAAGTVSVWRHAYLRIGEILKSKGAGAYAAEDRAAAQLLEEGRKDGNLDALRTLLDRYPNSRHVEPAWLELSKRLRESGREREALRAVQRQLARYGAVTAPLLAELARSLEGAGAYESARDVLSCLKDRFGRETMAGESGTIEVARYVDERFATEPYREVMAPPPIPESTIGLKPAWTEGPSAAGDEVVLVVPAGRRPRAADGLVLVHKDGELKALDLENGKTKWARPARSVGDSVRPIWHDRRLFAMIDGDLVSLDPATGKEHWRSTMSPGRVLAIHSAHGKAYVMLRHLLGGRMIQVRTLDVVTGEKLRDSDFAIPHAGAGEVSGGSSFGSSPLYLLCRLDSTAGTSQVLDAVTGESVLSQTISGGSTMPAVLTANNLFVTQSSSPPQGPRDITILARNPKTQQEAWRFKLQRVNGPIWPLVVTPEVAVFSVRFGGTQIPGRREIVVLDLLTGTTRMSIPIRTTDIPHEGVIAGDLLFAEFAMPDSKRFVRAYDMKKAALLWDSVTYTGGGLDLSIYPSRSYAIVRVSSKGATDRRTDMVHFFENQTGLLKDSITLENTVWKSDQADVDIREKALVLRGGSEVSVRK